MNGKSVSIIVAAYNNAPALEKALNAMLQLDYPVGFEIIVVNDGSTDNTKEVLDNFSSNPKIKVFHFDSNQGVCKARNKAISLAKNPFIVNMDQDSIPTKSWLKDLMSGFDSEKVGVVSSYGGFGGTSTGFRKTVLDKVQGYDEDYRYYREDTDLTFKIIEAGYSFKPVKAAFTEYRPGVKPSGFGLLKYVFQRWKYHMNDVLLFKKHPRLSTEFLDVKLGFIVNPLKDVSLAVGTWGEKKKLQLSSPRGFVFLENKTPLHAIVILLTGFFFMLGLKIFRLIGSIKYGKLLI